MALINYATREINAKIVFYGPGLSGKTTNIQYVFNKVKPGNKGKLISLATQGDRTLFFDFFPVELGVIKGFKTRFHLYTVPGQVFYNSTRKMVLKGSDGVVFVADSQKMMMDENVQSLENLRVNLKDMGITLDEFPVVLQYNKRDLPNAATLDELNKHLNPMGSLPVFEASALTGEGVLKTLTAIVKFVLNDLKDLSISQSSESVRLPKLDHTIVEDGPAPEVEQAEAPAVAVQAAPEADDGYSAQEAAQAPGPADEIVTFGALVDEGVTGTDINDAPVEVMEAEAVTDDDTDMELPEASPQLFGAFDGVISGEAAEEVYDAVEVPEGLGDMISDTSAYNTEEIPLTDNFDTEFTSGEVSKFKGIAVDDIPGPEAECSTQELFERFSGGRADTGHYAGMSSGDAGDDGLPTPGTGEPVPEARAERPVVEPAAIVASVRASREYRLPVKLTTPDGEKLITLKLSINVELAGEGMDSVTGVELLTPSPAHDDKAATPAQQKDESMHPPPDVRPQPAKPQQSRPPSLQEPRLVVRNTSVMEKMLGR
jgi:hypothetical protein